MSVSKSMQVLSKFYFRDTPEKDQGALRTIGSEWPNWGDFFAWSTSPRYQCGLWGGLSNGTVLPMGWGGAWKRGPESPVRVISLCIHKRHPTSFPHRRAMGCLSWDLQKIWSWCIESALYIPDRHPGTDTHCSLWMLHISMHAPLPGSHPATRRACHYWLLAQ